MKRIAITALTICLLAVCLFLLPNKAQAATVAEGTCGDNLTWVLDGEGTLTISGTGAMEDWNFSSTPWYSNRSTIKTVAISNGVTSIGTYAFYDCTELISVTIPYSVTGIGSKAFYYCTSLPSVTIPNSVTSIDYQAFYNCKNLTSVQLSTSITSISSQLFYKCAKLTSIKIPNSVTSIDESAFALCTGLTSVTIRDNVTTIGKYAFRECTGMTSLSIGRGVKSVSKYAFYLCTGLTEIYFNAADMNNLSIENYVFYKAGQAGEGIKVIIGKNVNAVPAYLFYPYNSSNVPKITSIEFEKGSICTYISSYAFYGCTYLTGVYITDLTAWCNTYFGSNLLYYAKNLYLNNQLVTDLVIPDDVTNIGDSAFNGCTSLTSVTIPGNVTGIGNNTFKNCTGINKITFVGKSPSFGSDVFYGVTASAYYSADDETWTEDVLQSYGGTITWVPYGGEVASVGGTGYSSFAEAIGACGEGQYLVMKAESAVEVVLTRDLYIDLNGFDLTGTVITNGYKIYGMDSTTDNYTCEAIGYMNLVDENGNAIVPVSHFKSDITGQTKRYMAIKDDNGYSFHRFYLGITHQSLKPTTVGVGYKAVFYGDTMVAANLDSFGFTMQLGNYTPKTVTKAAESFVSGKVITLRIDNYDVEKYGETDLYASVMLKLSDGTVIESAQCAMTMRSLLETLNTNYTALDADQLTAVAEMIKKYAIISTWKVENLI